MSSNREIGSASRLLTKRSLLTLWPLLIAAQAGAASLPWTWVLYNFGQTEKQLNLSGFDSYPALTAEVLFGLAAWAAVAVSRAMVRLVVSWLLVAVGVIFMMGNLGILRYSLTDAVSVKANSLVEKASGIAGGGPDGISAAITDHSNGGNFTLLYFLISLLLLAVQVAVALRSRAWSAGEKRDKYAVASTDKSASEASVKGKPTQKGQLTKKGKGAKKPVKGDNIALWDSQR
ncbi:MAG: Trp biosynthesis-associated membrane protein [Actinomycetales bacterium]|nr:Trp biosynthesis-associated membrane protein [Actinomycetales bacterium]